MDYTFRVRLSHVQVTSLTTLVKLLSGGAPQRVVCFRLAFDGKVEDLPLEPDLLTGDMTSSRGIRFVYRIRADSVAALEDTLARRYVTCQVLLKETPMAASCVTPDTFPVVAVLASATASVLELVGSPDPHFLFTLTELLGDADEDAASEHGADPYYIDSTEASVYKEEEDATQNSRVGGILGRKDGLVSLQLAVEEMRVVDVAFQGTVCLRALPPLTTVQLVYRLRNLASTTSAEQLGLATAAACRAQGFTLSRTVTATSDGDATFASQQLPRLAPTKMTPHDRLHHELEMCVLVGGSVFTCMHLPLNAHFRETFTVDEAQRASVSLPLAVSVASAWDTNGTALQGNIILSNVPCFLQSLASLHASDHAMAQRGTHGVDSQGQKRGSHSTDTLSGSGAIAASTPRGLAPGAVTLGNVREQVLRPASRSSAACSAVSSLSVSGPCATAKDVAGEWADDSNSSRTVRTCDDARAAPVRPASTPLAPPTPPLDPRTASSFVGDASPPQPSRTMIQYNDEPAVSALKDTAESDDQHRTASRGTRELPPPPPPHVEHDNGVDAQRPISLNASNINADTLDITSIHEDDFSHTQASLTGSATPAGSRRASQIAPVPRSARNAVADTVEAASAEASPSRPRPTRQQSTASRASATPAVSEELVLHFGGEESDAETHDSGARGRASQPHTRLVSHDSEPSFAMSPSVSPRPSGVGPATLPAWHPGPEPVAPTPRLAPISRPPPKSSAGFASTHARLIALSNDFRTLLHAYEGQQHRVEQAEAALSSHDSEHHVTDEDIATLQKREVLLAAQLETKKRETAETERQLQRVREAAATTGGSGATDGLNSSADATPELTNDDNEKIALYTEMEVSLVNLLRRAEHHRDELSAARDRQSMKQLVSAQLTLEADAVSLARLQLSPSPPTEDPPVAVPVRRRESLNAPLDVVELADPSTLSHVAEERTATVTAAEAVGQAAVTLSVPPALPDRHVAPVRRSSVGTSPLSPHQADPAAGRTPSPPSDAVPQDANPRARSPLYEPILRQPNERAVPPQRATSVPLPEPTAAVLVGFSQPCSPEAERRARQEWLLQHEALLRQQDAAPMNASASGIPATAPHPYVARVVRPVAEAQEVRSAPINDARPVHQDSFAEADHFDGDTCLTWNHDRRQQDDARAQRSGLDGRESMLGHSTTSLPTNPSTQLFPRLASSLVDRGSLPSPTPRPPSAPTMSEGVRADAPQQAGLLGRQPLVAARHSALFPSSPSQAVPPQTEPTTDPRERFFDSPLQSALRGRTPHRGSLARSSRLSSVGREVVALDDSRSPSHPYSVPRDFDGEGHYPLVSAEACGTSAMDMQVRALMQAIEDGDAEAALYVMIHAPNVLQSSDNFLHAACAATPSREAIVGAILDRRPELARGVDRESGNSALHIACSASEPNPRVIRQLIVAGVAVDTWNAEGYTAFHLAVLNPADALKHKAKDTLLTIGGAHVNERTEAGQTPLHLVATRDEYFTVVQFLVTHGADLWARAPMDIFVGSPYGYKGRERLVKTVTPPEAASLKGAIRNGRYFDRSLMNSRIAF